MIENLIGVVYKRMGDLDSAEEWFRKAMTDGLRDEVVLTNLGNVFWTWGIKDSAKIYYEKALQKNEKFVPALFNLSKVYLDRLEISEHTRLLKEARSVDAEAVNRFLARKGEQEAQVVMNAFHPDAVYLRYVGLDKSANLFVGNLDIKRLAIGCLFVLICLFVSPYFRWRRIIGLCSLCETPYLLADGKEYEDKEICSTCFSKIFLSSQEELQRRVGQRILLRAGRKRRRFTACLLYTSPSPRD